MQNILFDLGDIKGQGSMFTSDRILKVILRQIEKLAVEQCEVFVILVLATPEDKGSPFMQQSENDGGYKHPDYKGEETVVFTNINHLLWKNYIGDGEKENVLKHVK